MAWPKGRRRPELVLPLSAPCKRGHEGLRFRTAQGTLRCKACQKVYQKEHSKRWPERRKKQFHLAALRRNVKLKEQIIAAYGGKCECCGENKREFLTIDHIGGWGRKHRREIGNSGTAIKLWLVRNKFPEGFRILCWNCNCSRGQVGYCPHEAILRLVEG